MDKHEHPLYECSFKEGLQYGIHKGIPFTMYVLCDSRQEVETLSDLAVASFIPVFPRGEVSADKDKITLDNQTIHITHLDASIPPDRIIVTGDKFRRLLDSFK